MDLRSFLKRQLPVLGAFALLLPVWTLLVHGGVCFEGGAFIGFPWMFYSQCYGPMIPGGGQVVDPAEFQPLGLVLDLVFWYVVSMALVYVLRYAMSR